MQPNITDVLSCSTTIYSPAFASLVQFQARQVYCPSSAVRNCSAQVWGSSVYSSESSVCLAAVHAGALAPGGNGHVMVQLLPNQTDFIGSTARGVTTLNKSDVVAWCSWQQFSSQFKRTCLSTLLFLFRALFRFLCVFHHFHCAYLLLFHFVFLVSPWYHCRSGEYLL